MAEKTVCRKLRIRLTGSGVFLKMWTETLWPQGQTELRQYYTAMRYRSTTLCPRKKRPPKHA